MAEFKDRENFIPLRKTDLVRLLAGDRRLAGDEAPRFEQFAELVSATFHFEYLRRLEELKDAYAPFDPDADTRPLAALGDDERLDRSVAVFDAVVELMERANFRRLSREEIDAATDGGATDWGINMKVNWAVFERMEMFVRGDVKSTRYKKSLWTLFRRREVKVPAYQRLVLIAKLKPHRMFPERIDTKCIFLKMFKDIPKLDIEMLLPGTRLVMPGIRKLFLGGSLLSSLGMFAYKVAGDVIRVLTHIWDDILVASTTLATGPIVALGGIAYQQWFTYQNTRQTYTLQLTESLYYQNLDNNGGVLTRVLDEAEEQECREVLLGYFCLWKFAPPQGWTAGQLDDYVELYLEGAAKLKVDFEIGDALQKMTRLRLVEADGEHYRAVPIDEALRVLDEAWDSYFLYNNPSPAGQ